MPHKESAKLDDIDDLVEEELRKNHILDNSRSGEPTAGAQRSSTGPKSGASKTLALTEGGIQVLSADGSSLDLSPASRGSNEHASGESQ